MKELKKRLSGRTKKGSVKLFLETDRQKTWLNRLLEVNRKITVLINKVKVDKQKLSKTEGTELNKLIKEQDELGRPNLFDKEIVSIASKFPNVEIIPLENTQSRIKEYRTTTMGFFLKMSVKNIMQEERLTTIESIVKNKKIRRMIKKNFSESIRIFRERENYMEKVLKQAKANDIVVTGAAHTHISFALPREKIKVRYPILKEKIEMQAREPSLDFLKRVRIKEQLKRESKEIGLKLKGTTLSSKERKRLQKQIDHNKKRVDKILNPKITEKLIDKQIENLFK